MVASVIAVIGAVGYAAFEQGKHQGLAQGVEQGKQEAKQAFEEDNTIITIPKIASEPGLRQMEAKMKALNAKLAQLEIAGEKAKEGLKDIQEVDSSIIEAARVSVEALPRSPAQKAVPLPEGSASARVLAQPKTESGIPQKVVENYQKETGVNPAEIEALMRK